MLDKEDIQKILEDNKVTDYLFSKNILPIGPPSPSGKVKYLCPLHNEKTPSFFVYTEDKYENFFCYGCKTGGNFLDLYCKMENISFGRALRIFNVNVEIDNEKELSKIIERIKSQISEKKVEKSKNNTSLVMLKMGVLGRSFLEKFDFDKEVEDFLESVYKKIDEASWAKDDILVENMYDICIREKLFNKKAKYFEKKKSDKIREQIKAKCK